MIYHQNSNPYVQSIKKEKTMKKQKIFGKILIALVVTMSLVLTSFNTVPAQAETVVCSADDQSELMVSDGLTITWDSAFECEDVAEAGNYQISVGVLLEGDELAVGQQIVIDSLVLSEVAPVGEDEETLPTAEVNGLPLTLNIGENGSFDVSGMYELMETEEISELNLLFLASGKVEMIEETAEEDSEILGEEDVLFELGINLVLKGVEPKEEDEDDEMGEGPSTGFYCIQSDVPHPFGERLAERYGVDYTILQGWFCDGFGWGQIMLALQTGMITGDDPEALLEERSSGLGWGEIWQNLGLIGKDKSENDSEEIDSEEVQIEKDKGKPDFVKQSDDKDKDKDKVKDKDKDN